MEQRERGSLFRSPHHHHPRATHTDSHGPQAKKEGGCLDERETKICVQEPGGLNIDENRESGDITIPPVGRSAGLGTRVWSPGLKEVGRVQGSALGGPQGCLRSLLRPVGVSTDRRAVAGDVHVVGQARNKDPPAAKRSRVGGP